MWPAVCYYLLLITTYFATNRKMQLKSRKYLRVMGIRRAGLLNVRSRWQALHDGSWGIPSWRRILGCWYSVMVALAHFGQIPPMGIHILTLLRFSLAYHPFHTRYDTVLFLVLRFLLEYRICTRFTSPSRRLQANLNNVSRNETHSRDYRPFPVSRL